MKSSRIYPTSVVTPILLLVVFFSGGCKDHGTVPLNEFAEVNYISGTIGQFSEPPLPPDPISCQIIVQIRNRSESVAFRFFRWQDAKLYRASDGSMLGSFTITTSWTGYLPPLMVDTVVLIKPSGSSRPFVSPCGESVYIELSWVTNENIAGTFKTPIMEFGCAY
jgi:hypothetical protein